MFCVNVSQDVQNLSILGKKTKRVFQDIPWPSGRRHLAGN